MQFLHRHKFTCHFFSCLLLLAVRGLILMASDLGAQEESIAIEGADAWLPRYFDRVHLKHTEDAGSIITLTNKERSQDPDVDMLLHFNGRQGN